MIALAASEFPWPGNQNPRQDYYYRSMPVPVLLLRANDLRFGARSGATISPNGEALEAAGVIFHQRRRARREASEINLTRICALTNGPWMALLL